MPPRHHARFAGLEVALIVAGLCMALFVGRDGSPLWRAARAGAVLVVTAASASVLMRVGPRARGRFAALVGVVTVSVGVGFLPYLVKGEDALTAGASAVSVSTGVALMVAGTLTATRGLRVARRCMAGLVATVVLVLVAFVVGPAVAATNVPRPSIGANPASIGLTYQSARLTTTDGVELAAWYVPAANRAAVILLHGAGSTRSSVLAHAAVLARNGYGVLLIDARGHGESAGRAMDFGWYGDQDIEAATAFLSRRTDIDPSRIAVVGMSMGGEEALGATASNPLIRAVVAEGATARNAGDESWLSDEFGWRGALQEQLERAQDWITDLLTSASTPVSSRAAVAAADGTRYLLITAGEVPDEGRSAAHVASAAPDRVEVWTVDEAGHTGGLRTAPEEWEQRVTAFLGNALGLAPT
jgi:pimeloyl-ACP methyl ester carboxylesterase